MADAITEMTAEQVQNGIGAIKNGSTVGEALGASKQDLEYGYAMAYNLLISGNYKDAKTLFTTLVIYNPHDSRFSMGLGVCRQMTNELAEAVDAFMASAVMSELQDPIPLYNAATCLLKIGQKEEAIQALQLAKSINEDDDNKQIINTCNELLSIITK